MAVAVIFLSLPFSSPFLPLPSPHRPIFYNKKNPYGFLPLFSLLLSTTLPIALCLSLPSLPPLLPSKYPYNFPFISTPSNNLYRAGRIHYSSISYICLHYPQLLHTLFPFPSPSPPFFFKTIYAFESTYSFFSLLSSPSIHCFALPMNSIPCPSTLLSSPFAPTPLSPPCLHHPTHSPTFSRFRCHETGCIEFP